MKTNKKVVDDKHQICMPADAKEKDSNESYTFTIVCRMDSCTYDGIPRRRIHLKLDENRSVLNHIKD